MLAPRQIFFSAVEGVLVESPGSPQAAGEGLEALQRRRIPLVLSSRGARAELETVRRKIEHTHPFLVESCAALFIPDGYLGGIRLPAAERVGRYFCVPFAKTRAESTAAVQEIARKAAASVVCLSEMSLREIAQNMGISQPEAERFRQREFSELFFFAGETELSAQRFTGIAKGMHWEVRPGKPFWDLRSLAQRGDSPTDYLMRLYRQAFHTNPRSIGILSGNGDACLLSAVDKAIVLPQKPGQWNEALLLRPRVIRGAQPGPAGWSQAVLEILEAQDSPKR
jgi:mannosyl-3-phosphoglycerate phosphatase